MIQIECTWKGEKLTEGPQECIMREVQKFLTKKFKTTDFNLRVTDGDWNDETN